MKKLAVIILALMAIACKDEVVPKPKKLISENQMVDILYDMAIMQSVKSYKASALDSSGVDPKTYIYKKYKIDSLTLVQNHTWYASDLKNYEKMQKKITGRIEHEQEKLGVKKPQANVADPANPSNPANPNRFDSPSSGGGTPSAGSPALAPENRQLPQ
ncbi:DUF4296 domain-containing protein [Flavobacterium sp. RHBU_3]|uniref:DUF4296 domain-containing protein n=1 Tax=Flavobacterium sp. RHBU_3 TaxID=3391184 RepID=UPI0039847C8B